MFYAIIPIQPVVFYSVRSWSHILYKNKCPVHFLSAGSALLDCARYSAVPLFKQRVLQESILSFNVRPADLGLHTEVQELVNECEQPGLTQSLPLPEDLALRHLPALSLAHRRLDFTHRYPSLSSLQEVRTGTQTHTLGFKCVAKMSSSTKNYFWGFLICGVKQKNTLCCLSGV